MKLPPFAGLAGLGKTLLIALTLSCSALAHAVPITYTFEGTASGNLGTNTFEGSHLTVTIVSDTSNISSTRFGANTPASEAAVSASLSLGGLGSGTFNLPVWVFVNHNNSVVGFGDNIHNDLIDLFDSSLGLNSYNLVSAIGPVIGTPPFSIFQFQNVGTSLGTLSLSFLEAATFRATTDGQVPAPQSLLLLATGLIAARAARSRRSV